MQRNPYNVLGVSRTAEADEIRKNYKKLARKYHPDYNPDDPAAEERFKEVSAAYDVLSDPQRRALYDEFGEASTHIGFDADRARAARGWQSRMGGFGGRGGDFSDLFDLGDLFGAGAGRVNVPRRGADLRTEMRLSFIEAAVGTERDLVVDRPRPGRFKVRIPAGVEDGQTVRLAGKGEPGPHGGPPGDLLVIARVAPHAFFRREGRDVHLDLPITVREALFGARVEVPTLDGQVAFTIPPNIRSGRKLRLRGKGVPTNGKRPSGDLYVTLLVQPPRVDPIRRAELQALCEQLDDYYEEDVRDHLKGAE